MRKSSKDMKVLFFTYALPYPPTSGGKTRSYNLLKILSKKHQITLWTFARKNEDSKPTKNIFNNLNVPLKIFLRRPNYHPLNFLYMIAYNLPFTAVRYFSPQILKELQKQITNFDIIHFESFYPALYIKFLKHGVRSFFVPSFLKNSGASRGKLVFGTENIEYLIYQRFSETQSYPWKIFSDIEVWRTKKLEEQLYQLADLTISLSEIDSKTIKQHISYEPPLVPNAVDLKYFDEVKELRHNRFTILFSGDMTYFSNVDGLKHFLFHIWPKIKTLTTKKNLPVPKLLVSGRNMPFWVKKIIDRNIKIIDSPEDMRVIYKQADCLAAYLRFASGTRLKILEAWASNLPVVATSIAIEGLEAQNEKQVLICDRQWDFAQAMVKLMQNQDLSKKLKAEGRRLVEEKYTWERSAEELNKAWRKTNY